ncbi:MAG: HpcH/HpaI aldolase/citrate lyase family protein [Acetobacteraceae bacterium]
MASMKSRLRDTNSILRGYVCAIPSAVVTQAIASAGADWILIDQEHGPIGIEALHAMVAATAGTNCSPWVRVPRRDEAFVKPALDAGAEGILFPLVQNAADAADCVALTRYPPRGRRGFGPFVAHSRWNVEFAAYHDIRGPETVCGLLIETRSAVDNIEAICGVEGVDFMILATFDLSTDLGVSGQFDAPILIEAVQHAERVILEAGIPLGSAALSLEQACDCIRRGHRLPVHGFDVLMLRAHVREAMDWSPNTSRP